MLSRSNIRQYVKYIIVLLVEVQTHSFIFLQVLQDSTLRTHCMFHLIYLSTCDMKHFIGVYVHIFKV